MMRKQTDTDDTEREVPERSTYVATFSGGNGEGDDIGETDSLFDGLASASDDETSGGETEADDTPMIVEQPPIEYNELIADISAYVNGIVGL
jgi:hypothetical protein